MNRKQYYLEGNITAEKDKEKNTLAYLTGI
jgi:hypothetical protein